LFTDSNPEPLHTMDNRDATGQSCRRSVGSLYIFLGCRFCQRIQQVESEGFAVIGMEIAHYVQRRIERPGRLRSPAAPAREKIMRKMLSSGAAGLAAVLGAGLVSAAPLVLEPGSSGPVPIYDGRLPATSTLLNSKCGFFDGTICPSPGNSVSELKSTAQAILASSGGFIEAAGTTLLNPFGSKDVAFGFIFGGTQAPMITSVTLSGLADYSTSVEACGPIFGGAFAGCAVGSAGTATRSGGTGDSVTFTGLGHILIPPDFGLPATDGYVVFTNAPVSALIDPNSFFSVVVDGTTHEFTGFGLTPPSSGGGGGGTGAPEPATLGLLGLGLLGMQLVQRLRRRH
jgi:hypothetical protein